MFPVLLLAGIGVGAYLLMNRDQGGSGGRVGPTGPISGTDVHQISPIAPFDLRKHDTGDKVPVHVVDAVGRDGYMAVEVTEAFDNAPGGPIIDVTYTGKTLGKIVDLAGRTIGQFAETVGPIKFVQQTIAPPGVVDLFLHTNGA